MRGLEPGPRWSQRPTLSGRRGPDEAGYLFERGPRGLQTEHEFEGLVDGSLFVRRESPDVLIKALQIELAELFDQHACRVAGHVDLGSEGRRRCTS